MERGMSNGQDSMDMKVDGLFAIAKAIDRLAIVIENNAKYIGKCVMSIQMVPLKGKTRDP
jgi:hypothetical protein